LRFYRHSHFIEFSNNKKKVKNSNGHGIKCYDLMKFERNQRSNPILPRFVKRPSNG